MLKKPKGGKHTTPRQAVQMPSDWIAVAKQLAAKKQQPVMWYIVSAIGEAAEKAGIDVPKYPWEEELH